MTEKPSIVIISDSELKPSSLIELITKTEEINDNSGIIIQPWTIETKYYTAEVNFIGIHKSEWRAESTDDRVEALIIHMDPNKESVLKNLDGIFRNIEKDCNLEIKLLTLDRCRIGDKVTYEQALEWCLSRGFELIELNPSCKEDDSDLIKEKFGIERVIEVLGAHMWSNLVMKNPSPNSKQPNQASNTKDTDDCIKLIKSYDEIIKGDCLDDFSELISQLNSVRSSLQNLPSTQRKHCAEQLATAFWDAIGGDDEEIADL